MATNLDRLYLTLYTDADVHGKLAEQIRQKGFDAVSAYEVGNAGLDDPDQLEYAISQKRAILACNAKDFAPLFDQYWQVGKDHYGIIVSQQLSLGELFWFCRILWLRDLWLTFIARIGRIYEFRA